jgi:hypothetical protein
VSSDLVVPPMRDADAVAARPVATEAAPAEERVSYEEALAQAKAAGPEVIIAREPDMTDAELMAPMRQASFVAGCGAPEEMKVTLRVAVRRGRAVGVTVTTNPPNGVIARCVDEHVRRELRWPVKQKLDFFTVSY